MAASSRFSIAVHVLSCLEFMNRAGETYVSSEQIAMSVNTNPVVIRSLLSDLRKASIVESKEGKGGGTRLAKPASTLTLQEIYRAVERPSVLALNPKPEFKNCPVSCGIKKALAPVLKEIDDVVLASLKKRTLSEVVDRIS